MKIQWQPQEGPQELFLSCPVQEILYGGAAGGGKSDGLLGDFASGIEQYGSAWQGVIFRRSFPQLEELERRSLEIFGPGYGEKCYSIGNKQWKFPTEKGTSILRFRFLDKDKDVYNYQGQQYSWIGFDELTQWPTDFPYTYLWTRLRSPSGAPVYFRATTNPGGPGHHWVKARWRIGEIPPKTVLSEEVHGQIRKRVFIPAKVTDNKILMQNDPGYLYRLNELSNPALRKALRDGDWDIFAGQAFSEWNAAVHVIPHKKVPDNVRMWRSCDWGYKKPYCVLWFYADYDGNVVVCNELYGQGDGINVGNEESASSVRSRIETIENENGWWVPMGYLDPQCWESDDITPSIFEKLGGAKLGWHKWSKGPGSRKNQKMIVHEYLKVVNGASRLQIMDICKNLIRTLPAVTTKESDPEDIDTDCEDHCYDALRGGLVKNVLTRDERRRIDGINAQLERNYQRELVANPYGGW